MMLTRIKHTGSDGVIKYVKIPPFKPGAEYDTRLVVGCTDADTDPVHHHNWNLMKNWVCRHIREARCYNNGYIICRTKVNGTVVMVDYIR